MTVQLKIKIKMNNSEITTCALANTRFEGLGPDIMIPMNIAQALNIRLNPSDSEVYAIRTASGIAPIYRFKGYVLAKVIVNDRDTPLIPLSPVISESMDQVILSDKALSALGIVIINAGEGVWCFNDELGKSV